MAEDIKNKEVIDTAFEELQNEPVAPEDFKAVDLLRKLRDNAIQATKVWCAYNVAKTKENILEGKRVLSQNIDSMANVVVGKMQEGSKLYDEYKEEKDGIIEFYNNSADKIVGKIDKQLQDTAEEILALKLDISNRLGNLYILKKDKLSSREDTKETARNMKAVGLQVDGLRQNAMKAMQEGRLNDYQRIQLEISRLENDIGKQGLESAKAHAGKKQAFEDNKQAIKENRNKIKELKIKMKNLQDQKKEEIMNATHEKKRLIGDLRTNTGFRNVITNFLAKFSLNKAKKLREQVFNPAMNWIKETSDKVIPATQKKFSEIVQNAKNNVRNKGLDAVNRLSTYIEETKPEVDQMKEKAKRLKNKESLSQLDNVELNKDSYKHFNANKSQTRLFDKNKYKHFKKPNYDVKFGPNLSEKNRMDLGENNASQQRAEESEER